MYKLTLFKVTVIDTESGKKHYDYWNITFSFCSNNWTPKIEYCIQNGSCTYLKQHPTNESTHAILIFFFPPYVFFCTENMQVAQRAIWDRQPKLSYWINASLQTLRLWSNWVLATVRCCKNGESEISGRPSRGKWHQRMILQPSFCNTMWFLSLSVH